MPDFLRTASLMSGKACVKFPCVCVHVRVWTQGKWASAENELAVGMVHVCAHSRMFAGVIVSPSHQNHDSLFTTCKHQWVDHHRAENMHPILGRLYVLAGSVCLLLHTNGSKVHFPWREDKRSGSPICDAPHMDPLDIHHLLPTTPTSLPISPLLAPHPQPSKEMQQEPENKVTHWQRQTRLWMPSVQI